MQCDFRVVPGRDVSIDGDVWPGSPYEAHLMSLAHETCLRTEPKLDISELANRVRDALMSRRRNWLPPRYGLCTCHCHVISDIHHVAPCCYPDDELLKQDSGT